MDESDPTPREPLLARIRARATKVAQRARKTWHRASAWVSPRFDLPTNLAIVGVVAGTAAGWRIDPTVGLAVLSLLTLAGAGRAQAARNPKGPRRSGG